MAEHNQTGNAGEKIAEEYLIEKGYTILEKNWRHKRFELDLIAKWKNFLVVLEVKSRKGIIIGDADEWVTKEKQRNMIGGTNAYIDKTRLDLEVRFDVITVIFTNAGPTVTHIEDAFFPAAVKVR